MFLYVDTNVRIKRLQQRERDRFGDRILIGGDMHAIHEEFIDWASRYDAGDKFGYLQANIEYALKRPDLAARLRPYLREVAARR